jgi:hypothetical protein
LRNGDLNRLLNHCIEDFTKQSKTEVLILKQFESKRFGPNLNTLLNSTKCHYLIRQDPDDISVPSRVQEVFNFSQSNMFDVLFSNSINLDYDSPMKFSNSRVYTQSKSLFSQLIKLNPIVHSSAVLNVKSILRIGGYRDLSKYEDYELWLKISQITSSFIFVNEILGEYRRHDLGASSSVLRHLNAELAVVEHHISHAQKKDLFSFKARNRKAKAIYSAGRTCMRVTEYRLASTYFFRAIIKSPFFIRSYAALALTVARWIFGK